MRVQVRAIGPDEWRLWRGLRLRALAESPDAFSASLSEWEHADEQRWRSRLAAGDDFVAYLDEDPVGMASAMPTPVGVELIAMWVAPEVRGGGVGEALVRSVIGQADGPVSLRVKHDNEVATGLYRRCGFIDGDVAPDPTERWMHHQ